ncbi:MAG: four helix bundle protein [Crocinitomicaceae bacterium]
MGEIKSYKDLLIWQNGITLAKMTYELCEKFPKDEVYGIQSQVKRSAVSIASNIAEGWGRNYKQSFIHFLRIAKGSLFELETQMIIAKELKFVSNKEVEEIFKLIIEESKMLNAFIKKIESTK